MAIPLAAHSIGITCPEYSYTGTAEDALESLGLSYEKVAADPRLAHGLKLAEQEIQAQAQGMWM